MKSSQQIGPRPTSIGYDCGGSNISSIYSFHIGGAKLLFGDGSVRFLLRSHTNATIIAALITHQGGV